MCTWCILSLPARTEANAATKNEMTTAGPAESLATLPVQRTSIVLLN